MGEEILVSVDASIGKNAVDNAKLGVRLLKSVQDIVPV